MAKLKATFTQSENNSYAFRIEGVDPNFLSYPFGRRMDDMKKIRQFKETARTEHIGCKGKPTMAQVKKWVKEMQPKNFYAVWQSDSDYYKDDVVVIYFDDYVV